MRAAGLTHAVSTPFRFQGSARFRSLSQAAQSLASGLKSQIEGKPPDQGAAAARRQVSIPQPQGPAAIGCVLAALGSELARADARHVRPPPKVSWASPG